VTSDQRRREPWPVGFGWFWAGETVSSFGSAVTLLALPTLVVLTLGGSTQEVGWLSSARWLPYLVIGLLVGAWVDRVPRRPVMVGTDVARALVLVAIPAAAWADVLSLPLLLVLVLVFGTVSLFNDAASQSFLPRLVPGPQLQRAHARLDAGDAVAQSGGPALAGALITLLTAPVAVLVDALSYVFSAAVVVGLRVEEPPRSTTPRRRGRLRAEVLEGLRWVYGTSGLSRLATATQVWFAGMAILGVVVAPYALLTLDLTAFQLGLAGAFAGLGAMVGALGSSAVGRWVGTGWAIIASYLLAAGGTVVMAGAVLASTPWGAVAVLAAGQLVHGVGMGLSNSHEMSYRQLATPDALQARVNTSLRSMNRAVLVVGAPVAGLLAGPVGNARMLLVAAAVFALSAGFLVASPVRRDRSTVS